MTDYPLWGRPVAPAPDVDPAAARRAATIAAIRASRAARCDRYGLAAPVVVDPPCGMPRGCPCAECVDADRIDRDERALLIERSRLVQLGHTWLPGDRRSVPR